MSTVQTTELVAYNRELEQLRATVAQLDTVDAAKELADRAAAAQTWARRARLGQDAVNTAAEVKLRAERRAGELLSAARGAAKRLPNGTIADADISLDQSSEWQALAAVPDEAFDRAVGEAKADGEVTRSGVMRRAMDVHYSSETDLWSTPQDLYDELHAEFGFTLDVCAIPDNAKCPNYFTAEQDGLAQEWRGVCWMNPPYGDAIARWVEKAYRSGQEGATVVCLVPARVDTGWWWNHCRYGEIRFLRGRLKFGGGENSAPFPSAVVIFGRPEAVIWWER
jgi:phage N-6-adenine-methyltransferase